MKVMKLDKLLPIFIVTCLQGCGLLVTVNSTKEQLKSSDIGIVRQAEDNIVEAAVKGEINSMPVSDESRMEYIDIAPNNETLYRIIENSHSSKITEYALDRVDFSKEGASSRFVKEYTRKDRRFEWDDSRRGRSRPNLPQIKGEKYFAKLDVKSLEELYRIAPNYPKEIKENLVRIIVTKSTDSETIMPYMEDHCAIVFESLGDRVEKIDNEDIIIAFLTSKSECAYAKGGDLAERLIVKLSDEKKIELGETFIVKMVSDFAELETRKETLSHLMQIKNLIVAEEGRTRLLDILFSNLSGHDMKWLAEAVTGLKEGLSDEIIIKELANHKNVITYDCMQTVITPRIAVALLTQKSPDWQFYNEITENDLAVFNIYDMDEALSLFYGRAELVLCKKIADEDITRKLYDSVKSKEAKKLVKSRMSEEDKLALENEKKERYLKIVEQAKNAANTTYALDGFYLGMTWDDMKAVLEYVFPDYKCTEPEVSSNHIRKIMIPKQENPFAISDENGAVIQFNFGKSVLKKWYGFDVQNEEQWAEKYARKHHVEVNYVQLESNGLKYDIMNDVSYPAYYWQETYQHKDNSKGYRIIYFGALHSSGSGNYDIAPGDRGSMRVMIEND